MALAGLGERGRAVARLLGTDPRSGFEVSDSASISSLTLAGRHRFSRYMLTFALTDGADGTTQLRALSCAARSNSLELRRFWRRARRRRCAGWRWPERGEPHERVGEPLL
jgi:hypothetical protein